jgi:hypothetical protein
MPPGLFELIKPGIVAALVAGVAKVAGMAIVIHFGIR